MKLRMIGILVLGLAAAVPGSAQLLPPNAAGVSAGHEHIYVTDLAVSTGFWTALGGVQTPVGSLNAIKFPGVLLLTAGGGGGGARGGARGGGAGGPARGGAAPGGNNFVAAQAPGGAGGQRGGPGAGAAGGQGRGAAAGPRDGSVGSVVDSLGFKVKSLRDTLAKLEAIGIKPEAAATATAATVMSPEKVKVLLIQDTALATAIAGHEMVMRVPNPTEGAAWYAKWFGARTAKQGNDVVAEIPGMNMRFTESKEPAARTQGRALDHIGFEVKNLQAFMTKLAEGGVTISMTYRAVTLGPVMSVGFVTDPWGTYIELNEGFSEVK